MNQNFSNITNITKPMDQQRANLTYYLIGIFLLILFDFSLNFLNASSMSEIVFDFVIEFSIIMVVFFMLQDIWRYTATKQKLADDYKSKSENITGYFHQKLNLQFQKWQLSPSETEIALELLQGYSSKEIAKKRFTSERTVRNQSAKIYEKSNLPGKNQFIAHFLKELLKA